MKKFLSLFLSLTVIITTVNIAFNVNAQEETAKASESESVQQDVTPVVIVPGIGSSALYLNPNTDEQTSCFSLTGDTLAQISDTHFVKDTLKILFGRNVDANIWINKLASFIEPFTILNYDQDCNSLYNIGIDCYWEDSLANHEEYLDSRSTAEPAVCKAICDKIGSENVWLFNYDFREDVIADANQLAEFVQGVKEQSGKDKVTFVGCSLGTCVLSAYIDMYQYRDDISKAIFVDGAMCGVSATGLYSKDVNISTQIVMEYMSLMSEYYNGTAADFSSIEKMMNTFKPLLNNFVDFLNTVFDEEHIDSFYMQVLLPILGNIPSLWECIPYDDFDDAVNTVYQMGYLDPYSQLYSTICEYHEIQGRLEDNLKQLQENGVEVAIVCGYGLPTIPITSASGNQSDMLIDTQYASFGATLSKTGETLDNATSPDNMIDTSTCAFENSTWFLNSVQHMEFVYGTDQGEFLAYLCTTDTTLTIDDVYDDSGYSQFMALEPDGTSLTNVE